MTADQAWHLDHTTPRSLGGHDADARPAHAHCNIVHGSGLGNARKRELIAKGRAVEAAESRAPVSVAPPPPAGIKARRPRKVWQGRQVIALMGAPGAGKSTFAQAYPHVVTTDALRGQGIPQVDAVFDRAFDTLTALLRAGQPVVFDSTLAHPVTRKRLLRVARGFHASTRLIVFRTSVEVCINRQRDRVHPVPIEKVREIHASIEAQLSGLATEGWDSIEEVFELSSEVEGDSQEVVVDSLMTNESSSELLMEVNDYKVTPQNYAHNLKNMHFFTQEASTIPRAASAFPSLSAPSALIPVDLEAFTPGPADPAWDRAEWLTGLREVPATATWPRLMTLPHPLAVGSYGAEAIAWSRGRLSKALRWWQQLALVRILEHDAEGALVWPSWLVSTARQVGKSWLLRELFLWRIHQGERFGEEQLVLHTAKDLAACTEVMRPAKAWARLHEPQGYKVREANGQIEIASPDGGRWLVRARSAIYGYSASLAAVDEAWKVMPDVVEDGLEPTMAERASAQIGLISTAHRFATGLMQSRRSAAIEQLDDPRDTLILEWSAPATADIDDPKAWRLASPHWSAVRERLVDAQHRRVLAGAPSTDFDEPDPLASFKSQWLNQWPPRPVASDGRGDPLLPEGSWAALAELGLVPSGELVLGLEDWFGQGAATAAAGHLPDGRLFVWGTLHSRRSEACGWLSGLAGAHPGSRLVLGASLEGDPDAAAIDVETRELAGQSDTRSALPLLRELVASGRVAHDGGTELGQQVESARVVESRAGGLQVAPGPARTDLLRCAAWALAVLARLPVPEEEPAIF